ncbi:sensor histidine kinase [Herpetosiphon giganteus]|uniref:sensor histidine kinase n=1 Tax=Herpetosiphon giganteus TaxID=2029754 RepID=UPI00195F0D57|nr:sensor histidine kinase [Herpetosiphon giganteus]MBM7845178.1 signal transduction histidine kinase [Herpetosiphon giganteus]
MESNKPPINARNTRFPSTFIKHFLWRKINLKSGGIRYSDGQLSEISLPRNRYQRAFLDTIFMSRSLWTLVIGTFTLGLLLFHGVWALIGWIAILVVHIAIKTIFIPPKQNALTTPFVSFFRQRDTQNDDPYQTIRLNVGRGFTVASDIYTDYTSVLYKIQSLVNAQTVILLLADPTFQAVPKVHCSVGANCAEIEQMLQSVVWDRHQGIIVLPNNESLLVIQLAAHTSTVGYLCITAKIGSLPFHLTNRELLLAYGGQIALLIRNSQLKLELKTQAKTLEDLYEQMQTAQEAERRWLASELHDESLQTAIHLHRQLAINAHQNSVVRQCHLLSHTLIDQLRRVCMAMRPLMLDDLGLIAALDTLAQEQSDRLGIAISLEFNASIDELAIDPHLELVLYRTAQEAINNSIHHGRASHIKINLDLCAGHVQLVLHDNGRGFDVPQNLKALMAHGHLGLIGIKERIEHVGGKLQITSSLETGTTIHATIPLALEKVAP